MRRIYAIIAPNHPAIANPITQGIIIGEIKQHTTTIKVVITYSFAHAGTSSSTIA